MKALIFATLIAVSGVLAAKPTGSNYVPPEGLVRGGSFIDLFLPVPLQGELVSDTWGGENVIPRDVKNGIEDAEFSYWGGRMVTGDDGKEHLFVCRWPEGNIKGNGKASGHHTWWDSTIVHAVSDSPMGPFKVIAEVGKGHNPEIYRLKDGSYKIGAMGKKAYASKTLDGPWEAIDFGFKWLGEPLNTTNRTYVVRDDGSVLMMNKNGYVFISEKGDEQFTQVSEKSVYPRVPQALLEDPVIWKDEVQYHLVMNDALGRTAFYLRSPDGLDWTWDPGVAYNPTIMKHVGGTSERWDKFERPKVRQDRYGRATHMNFAVIDSTKDEDVANDNHSSKNVVIPLTISRRLEILNESINQESKEIRVKIMAEDGFEPGKDLDVKSLSFGSPEAVDFGKGFRATASEMSGADLIVTFTGEAHGIDAKCFAAKMIGSTTSGELLFGYCNLPKGQ